MQIRGDRIARWREYQYADETDWDRFAGDSRIDDESGFAGESGFVGDSRFDA